MNKITEKEAFDRVLPKWPQMLASGDTVTIEQAKEIIFATDTSLTHLHLSGNDREFEDWFLKESGYEKFAYDYKDRSQMTKEEKKRDTELSQLRCTAWDQFLNRANFLSTEYVHNSWASCAYIYGPHGWCHPSGKISFTDNVGKWPSVDEIASDWKKIAARWPFLNLWVTLMNAEHCDKNAVPVVTMYISNGTVEYYEGTTEPIKDVEPRTDFELGLNMRMIISNRYTREHGLPQDWIEEFIEEIRPIVDQVAAEFSL